MSPQRGLSVMKRSLNVPESGLGRMQFTVAGMVLNSLGQCR